MRNCVGQFLIFFLVFLLLAPRFQPKLVAYLTQILIDNYIPITYRLCCNRCNDFLACLTFLKKKSSQIFEAYLSPINLLNPLYILF